MRKTNQEIKDKQVIETMLRTSIICRLGMIDGDLPYVLPFNYGYEDEHIYIHCAREGKKLDIFRKNPQVCFEIEEKAEVIPSEKPCRWATAYRSILGYGQVEIVDVFEEKLMGLEVIMKQHGWKNELDFDNTEVDAIYILKIRIDTITAKRSGNWDRRNNS